MVFQSIAFTIWNANIYTKKLVFSPIIISSTSFPVLAPCAAVFYIPMYIFSNPQAFSTSLHCLVLICQSLKKPKPPFYIVSPASGVSSDVAVSSSSTRITQKTGTPISPRAHVPTHAAAWLHLFSQKIPRVATSLWCGQLSLF